MDTASCPGLSPARGHRPRTIPRRALWTCSLAEWREVWEHADGVATAYSMRELEAKYARAQRQGCPALHLRALRAEDVPHAAHSICKTGTNQKNERQNTQKNEKRSLTLSLAQIHLIPHKYTAAMRVSVGAYFRESGAQAVEGAPGGDVVLADSLGGREEESSRRRNEVSLLSGADPVADAAMTAAFDLSNETSQVSRRMFTRLVELEAPNWNLKLPSHTQSNLIPARTYTKHSPVGASGRLTNDAWSIRACRVVIPIGFYFCHRLGSQIQILQDSRAPTRNLLIYGVRGHLPTMFCLYNISPFPELQFTLPRASRAAVSGEIQVESRSTFKTSPSKIDEY
ncbi:hypothetical protein FB451DRAFT_1168538 [Mycena latifolia]|nr:hypothetical protein FB451DRAFT_1168538 [Mycena latifolia]